MATIKAIEKRTVHQIQSGQVIVDLSSVVKELVENSFDAGATNVEVKFKNQGLDSIEVQDNGSGISPENYETVALKHYTSKLSTYTDLDTLETFGFRGEALSSLCALSKFAIITCLESAVPKGTRLEFETSGKLKGKGIVAAQKGTTICIENLFNVLPVRRRELERNIKKEWAKVIGLLNQYACIQTGVKFTVSQQPTKGKRIVLFSTKGNKTTRENLMNVFGAKTLTMLIPLELALEFVPTKGPHLKILQRTQVGDDARASEVRVVGQVSRPSPGEGRQTPDRQMFYVNGRPCGLPQFAKVFNEAYRSYSPNQSPFIFADIKLDTHLYDVNVSPDKRSILLHDQGKMLDSLRDALVDLFESQTQTVPVSQPTLAKHLTPFKKPGVFRRDDPVSQGTMTTPVPTIPSSITRSRNTDDGHSEADSEDNEASSSTTRRFARFTQSARPTTSTRLKETPLKTSTIPTDDDFETEGEESDDPQSTPPRHHYGSPLPIRSDKKVLPQQQSPQSTHRIRDFHARMATMRNSTSSLSNTQVNDSDDEDIASSPQREPSIPSISPCGKQVAPPGSFGVSPISRAPKRPPTQQEVASITIGETTVTTVIGSQAKRPRIGDPTSSSTQSGNNSSRRASRKGHGSTAPLPSFGGRLSQMFAAAAARQGASESAKGLEATRGNGWEDIEDEDMEDGTHEDEIDEHEPSDDEGQDGEDGEGLGNVEGEESDEDTMFVSDNPKRRQHENEDVVMDDAPTKLYSQKGKDIRPEPPEQEAEGEDGDNDNDSDTEFIPEDEKRKREEAKVAELIAQAEPPIDNEAILKRELNLMRPKPKRLNMFNVDHRLSIKVEDIIAEMKELDKHICPRKEHAAAAEKQNAAESEEEEEADVGINAQNAEAKLSSLIIDKSDFQKMKIIGQFNLGFIIARRSGTTTSPPHNPQPSSSTPDGISSTQKQSQHHENSAQDDLFIIDQHASDEKYNFERLQRTTTVASQRLVNPKQLSLTALEEEIVINNIPAIQANGFNCHVDASGDVPVGSRVQLLSLPLSRELTFGVDDFEELVALLGEGMGSTDAYGRGSDNDEEDDDEEGGGEKERGKKQKVDLEKIPRPSKVRRMFAMRACRSSVMIGRALTAGHMRKLVSQMGGMDKPWNCPHGRPTMRHLMNLGAWGEDEEDDEYEIMKPDVKAFMKGDRTGWKG